MDCEQARQLFDAYLDGELAPAQATELGTHRVRCADCRQALALLEVSEHLIASAPERRELGGNFTNRLLACMDLPDESWSQGADGTTGRGEPIVSRIRRGLFWTGVSAAAALVALAFLGAFDRRGESRVAGLKIVDPDARAKPAAADSSVDHSAPESSRDFPENAAPTSRNHSPADPQIGGDQVFQDWLGRVRTGIETKRRSVRSLREAFDRWDPDVPESDDFDRLPSTDEESDPDVDDVNALQSDELLTDDDDSMGNADLVSPDAEDSEDGEFSPTDELDESIDEQEESAPVRPATP